MIGIGYHHAEKEREAIDNLLRKRCSCLVVHSKALSDEELQHYLENVPGMVVINRVIAGYEIVASALITAKVPILPQKC